MNRPDFQIGDKVNTIGESCVVGSVIRIYPEIGRIPRWDDPPEINGHCQAVRVDWGGGDRRTHVATTLEHHTKGD